MEAPPPPPPPPLPLPPPDVLVELHPDKAQKKMHRSTRDAGSFRRERVSRMSNAAMATTPLPRSGRRSDPVPGASVAIVTVKLALAFPFPRMAGIEKEVGEKLQVAFAGKPVQANCAVRAGM